MTETDTPWYKTFFGEDYLHIYEPVLTPERTQREVDGIVNLLALPQGSSILDLCCGHGRHAIPLARHGYKVTGQDLSEVFLREAEKEALAKGVHVDWLHGDMRNIPFENEFDAVINIFRSEEHTSELQSRLHLVCRLLLEKKKHTAHMSADSTILTRYIPEIRWLIRATVARWSPMNGYLTSHVHSTRSRSLLV